MSDNPITPHPNGPDLAMWRKHTMKLTQADLAEAVGMSMGGIVKIERDRETPVPLRLRLACAALALGIEDFDFGKTLTFNLERKQSKGVHRK